MLEERLLNMSFELASSRTREDEQNLIIRRSSTRMTEDNISDSARSLALLSSTCAGGIIDNMTTKFDRIERRSDNLRVDFPTGRRHSTMMMDEYSAAAAAMNSAAPRQRRTVVGRLFRSRISCSLPGDAAAAAEIIFEQDERNGAHRKPKKNPKLLHDDDCSTRLIGSTIFPMEDDNYSLGFE